MNDYYENTGVPAPGADGRSADTRAEFARVEAGFEKLPALTGNGSKFVRVDAGGTQLEVSGLLTETAGGVVIQGAKLTGAAVTALFDAPPAVGGATPSAGVFTTLRATDPIPAGDGSDRVATTAFVAAAQLAGNAALPGQTGNSGGLLKTRAGSAFWSKAELELEIVSGTSVTAEHGKHYVLTNAAATTVTAPAAPAVGDQFRVTVANGRADNAVAWNGSKHENLSDVTMVLDDPTLSFRAVFVSAGYGYKVTA